MASGTYHFSKGDLKLLALIKAREQQQLHNINVTQHDDEAGIFTNIVDVCTQQNTIDDCSQLSPNTNDDCTQQSHDVREERDLSVMLIEEVRKYSRIWDVSSKIHKDKCKKM